ncbi:MAG: thioredoxin domain-containing protein [Sphingomonadales bacterium]
MTARPDRNYLSEETSPYLLQHADNPVHWMAWGEDAFAAAQASNLPILLSVGYAACHWCHVMAHESFEDEDVARLMNRHFICVKVDREERPDVDQIYQHALALLGQHGGWPLTMFLTPTGDPFWGGTYFPPRAAHGRPGFPEVLERISHVFETEPEKIAQNRDGLARELAKLARTGKPGDVTADHLDTVARALVGHLDRERGGFGGAPKFPQPFLYEFLWRRARATGSTDLEAAVVTTLDHMAEGGIYDHLGGGFARYSVDADWLVPHFEKMLYDNAQLVSLYALVWQKTKNPVYKQRVTETIAWMDREMTINDGGDGGGFAAALDADSEGREGAFYVWRAEDITAILTDDAPAFIKTYGVTERGNWEGVNILNRLHRIGAFDDLQETRLTPLRAKLLAARDNRPRPARDDKVLADWNGLAIEGLVRAGQAFGERAWIDRARKAYDFIVTHLAVPQSRKGEIPLFHSYCEGTARHPALLDDYANMAAAALALHEATADPKFLGHAEGWAGIVHRNFTHEDADDNPGYFTASRHAHDLIVRPRTIRDTAVPAGNATMIRVLATLYHLTGKTVYRARADAIASAFASEIDTAAMAVTSYLSAVDGLHEGLQIIIRGDGDNDDTRALVDAVHRCSLPGRILQVVDTSTSLPTGHPATGKSLVQGRAAAYVCRGQSCSAPVTNPADLEDLLSRPPSFP